MDGQIPYCQLFYFDSHHQRLSEYPNSDYGWLAAVTVQPFFLHLAPSIFQLNFLEPVMSVVGLKFKLPINGLTFSSFWRFLCRWDIRILRSHLSCWNLNFYTLKNATGEGETGKGGQMHLKLQRSKVGNYGHQMLEHIILRRQKKKTGANTASDI